MGWLGKARPAKEGTAEAGRFPKLLPVRCCRHAEISYRRPNPAFDSMKDDDAHEPSKAETEARQQRRDMRRALTFGVVMATIQMGILLYFVYC
jgi:hypothetical protein